MNVRKSYVGIRGAGATPNPERLFISLLKSLGFSPNSYSVEQLSQGNELRS